MTIWDRVKKATQGMSKYFQAVIWFALNFLGLYLGSFATTTGINSPWYTALKQAPWTPPGYIFGIAWTTIMIAFSIYLFRGWRSVENKRQFALLFGTSWLLNVLWNPIFFVMHQTLLGLVVLIALLLSISAIAVLYRKSQGRYTLLLAPYLIWLVIAASLNAYIIWQNPIL